MSNLQNLYQYLVEDKTVTLTEIIEKRIAILNISQRASSEVLGIERKTLQRILSEDHQKIDVLTLLKFAYFLNTDMEELIKIYIASMSPEEFADLEKVKKTTFILDNFDLESLKSIGLIKDKSNFEEIEQKIVHFFSLQSIYDYERELKSVILFSQTKRSFHDQTRELWLKSIEMAFRNINNPYPYKEELLKELIKRIPAYSQKEKDGLATVIRALYMIGITVLVQPYPKNTQIRGASFFFGKKPCIILTDFNKRYDTLWFALLHELYHILFDAEILLKTNYHLSGENDLFLVEENANDFARNRLLSEEKAQYIYKFINIPSMVENCARKWQIHPSTIYGTYIYDHPQESAKYRNMIPKSEIALQTIQHNLYAFESIEEAVKNIKSTLFLI